MSLSNPTLRNPAARKFQWAGSTGDLAMYDPESKKNIRLKLPFEFIVLDQLAAIGGFAKRLESGIWSNEVRNTVEDTLYVKTKKGPVEAGKYRDLTETTKLGGKYCAVVYIAYKQGGEWKTGRFMCMGSALSSWIEFRKAYDAGSGKIVMNKGDQLEAQTGPYWPPTFSLKKWEPDELSAATALDEDLQIYLGKVLNMPRDEDGHELLNDQPYASPEQQEDFAARKDAAGMGSAEIEDYTPPSSTPGLDSARAAAGKIGSKTTADEVESEKADQSRADKEAEEHPDPVFEIGDEPINIDDIPF